MQYNWKKMRIFAAKRTRSCSRSAIDASIIALEFILIAIAMNNVSFPKITTTVQAEPWAEGHVARFTSTRVVPQTPRPHRNITVNVMPR